jgi:hypothetical protein
MHRLLLGESELLGLLLWFSGLENKVFNRF